jgi:hypothetical protein
MRYSIEPSKEVLFDFCDEAVSNKPIVMLNMLRFREQADYGGTHTDRAPCSGREAYGRYARGVILCCLK